MTGTSEIQHQGKPEMYFQNKAFRGLSEKERRSCGDMRCIQAQREKTEQTLLCQEFQALKCFSAKVHIFLSWQGVQQMDTQPACPPMPRSLEGCCLLDPP